MSTCRKVVVCGIHLSPQRQRGLLLQISRCLPFFHAIAIANMITDVINWSIVHKDDMLRYVMVTFVIIHTIFHIDRLIHLLCRLFLAARVHPELGDVLSLPAEELDYPLVAVQLPMMNEIECCESVIACACNLDWPKSRLVIQVLDYSTDEQTKIVIDNCIQKWKKQKIQINAHRRPNRHGFIAGDLNTGMPLISHANYVAIFYVDFLPTKDYLVKTIPPLIHDPNVAFVQARWTFTNRKETLLTRMQEVALNFTHKCEQESRFRASLFFGFKGTGGVWRTSAIRKIGGWHTDTLVEDLDLSLRAYLNGWRAVYMHDVECLSELPPTLSAYFSQQHRWSSGPMQVMKKMLGTICQSKHLPWYKKLYCIWYLLRSCTHLVTFITLVLIIPIHIWKPEMNNYTLFSILLPTITSVSYIAFTPGEVHLIIINVLFLNGISLHKASASKAGFLNYGDAERWIVTPKLGLGNREASLKTKSIEKNMSQSKHRYSTSSFFTLLWSHQQFEWTFEKACRKLYMCRFHQRNLWMAIYLLVIACVALKKKVYLTCLYIFSTSIMYFILAFNGIERQTE